ncbi:WDR26 [Cordylochernes scorpioides]|uniref:WDR26 n=1 Tax=Cordylochernes scorpioides TaxID=51811 RepID=A0ABY6JX51_9ARAC|nr:WDR26 [Cordylochernes scorpioides]
MEQWLLSIIHVVQAMIIMQFDFALTNVPEPRRNQMSYSSDVWCSKTADELILESGCRQDHPVATKFQSHVLNGDWQHAEELLAELQNLLESKSSLVDLKFLLLEQKYLEYLEDSQVVEALFCLRHELSPLKHNTQRVHHLSSLMMCSTVDDLHRMAQWEGKGIASRRKLMEKLQTYLPSSIMLPPRRLESLLRQAVELQKKRCPYHQQQQQQQNTGVEPISLLTDHVCGNKKALSCGCRENFPSEIRQVLTDHCDEVWFCRFSNSGTKLATGCKDSTIVIWDIHPETLELTTSNVLYGLTFGISNLAWSPDDHYLLACGTEESSDLWIWNTQSWLEASRSLDVTFGSRESLGTVDKEACTKGNHHTLVDFTKVDSAKVDSAKVDFTKVDSAKVDFTKVDSAKVDFTKVDSAKVDFTKVDSAKVDSAKVDSAKVDSAKVDFTKVDSAKVDFTKVDSAKVDFTKVDSAKVDSAKVDFTKVDSAKVDFTKVDFTKVDSAKVDFTKVDSAKVDFTKVDSAKVDFTKVDSAKVDSAKVDSAKVDFTKVDSAKVDFTKVDSAKVDFTKVDSAKVDSAKVDFTKVDSAKVDFTKVDFTKVDSAKVDFTKVDSAKVDFTKVDSAKVDFTKVDSAKVDSAKVDFTKVDFTKVDSAKVDSAKVDFTKVDSAKVDFTKVDSAKVDSAKVDSAKVDFTKVDSAKVDFTKVDSAKVDFTKVRDQKVLIIIIGLLCEQTGELKLKMTHSPEDSLTCCAWHKDGEKFATGGIRGQFYQCDLEGNLLNSWEGVRVQCLAYSRDGSAILAADKHQRIRCYNFETLTDTQLVLEDYPIISFALNHTGNLAILNCVNQRCFVSQGIHLWNLEDKTLVRKFRGVQQGRFTIHSCFGGPNDIFIASGSEVLGDLMISSLPRVVKVVKVVKVSCASVGGPNDIFIASGSEVLGDLMISSLPRVVKVSCASVGGPNDIFIASGSEDSRVYIWNITKETPIAVLEGHHKTVNCVSWNPKYPLLASASDDCTVRIWGPKLPDCSNPST